MTNQEKMRKKAAKLTNPKPVELPSGIWRCQARCNGKRLSATDADPTVAHAKLNAMRKGILDQPKKVAPMTVGEMLDKYIEDCKKDGHSPATIRGYKDIRRTYFEDIIDVKKDALTSEIIQEWSDQFSKNHSPKTTRNGYGLLTAALCVYRKDFTPEVKLPKKEKYEIQIPNEDEIAAICQGCKGTEYELPISLAMFLGLRASEIRGLTWDAISGDRMHIKAAVVRGDEGDAEKSPKTISGDRWLKIPQNIQELLGKQPHTNGYIVDLSQNAMRKALYRICDKQGIRRFRFHDLRHVFASVAISVGTPLEYIRREIGHKDDTMIKNVYGHMLQSVRDEYSDKRDAMFLKISAKTSHETSHGN